MKWIKTIKDRFSIGSKAAGGNGQTTSTVSLNIPPAKKPRTPVELFEEVLKRLGCTFETEQDDDEKNMLYHFMYQGGAFHVHVPKEGIGLLKAEFPGFVEANEEQMENLRDCCNRFSMICKLSKFVYTFDASENKYQAHIVTPFMLNDGMETPAYFVKALLESHFDLRRDFVQFFEENKRKQNNTQESDLSYRKRVAYLLREQEISHQSEPFQMRRTQSASLRLTDMLDLCYGLHDLEFAYMKTVEDEKVTLEFDQEKIAAYDLKQNATDITHYIYFNDTNGDGSSLRTVEINLRKEYEDEVACYLRLSSILFPSVYGADSTFVSGRTGLDALTFLIAIDKQEEAQYHKEYNYLWNDALDKKERGETDQLTEDQKFLLNADEPDIGYYLFRGRRLYADGRYYEAVDFLTHAFFYLNDEHDSLTNEQHKAFHELAFLIGFSYMELQLFAEAYYFLDIVHDLNNLRYAQEYVNCLVNSNDFRASDTINNLMSFVRGFMMQSDEEDEDVPEHITEFYHFLRRRQVFLWVNQDHLDEAERECNNMLEEPINADFALDELAYIQKLRRSGVENIPIDDLPF